MTCIVGLVGGDGTVYIGGDSAGIAGLSLSVRSDPKVFQNGEFVFGFTDSFRMGQVLRYRLQPPLHPPGKEEMEYMVVDFVEAVRKCLKEAGYARKDNEVESGGLFLVGYRGRLFRIDRDYQIGEAVCGYEAVGCGDDLALGALYATRGGKPRDRVLTALEASAKHSTGVCGPFSIVCA